MNQTQSHSAIKGPFVPPFFAFLFTLSLAALLAGCTLAPPGTSGGSSIWTSFGYTATWRSMGSPTTNIIGPISIAAGPAGTAAVVYQDWGPSRATGMQFNGSTWTLMGAAGFSAATIVTPSVAYDSGGNVWVAYQDSTTPPNQAFVQEFSGGAWTSFPAVSPGAATDTSLALDSLNTPYIAFSDATSIPIAGAASVMKYNGVSWVYVGPLGFSGVAGGVASTSIAIDGSNNIYVGYADGNVGNGVTVRIYNSLTLTWNLVGLQGFAGPANFVSLAINPISSEPYVLFNDQNNSGKATVWRYNTGSGAWVSVGTQGFSSGLASGVSLKFDSAGIAYAGFKDAGIGNKGAVMKFNGTAWIAVGGAGFTPGFVQYDSMTVDSNGRPTFIYSDLTTNLASAFKFY